LSSQYTIAQILQFQQVSQYLAGNEKFLNTKMKSGSFVGVLPNLLYMEGSLLSNLNSLNPTTATLRGTAEYVLSLCGKFLLQAQSIINNIASGVATISNPANQSVNVGQSATFSVTVTSSTPYTLQWYRNGIAIPGATGLSYTLLNAQLTDSGAMFSAIATNAAGPVSSNTATLTVTALLTAQWWFGSTDPYAALSAGSDTLSYQINQTITHDAAITINYPIGAENNQFNVLRYPNTENQKTTWFNTNLNNGIIGDPQMRNILNINNFYYIVSRVAMSLDNVTTSLTYT